MTKEINLRDLRERLNMTQQELADKLNTTKGTISNWENRPGNVSFEKLLEYLDAVGASISDFDKNRMEYINMNINVNSELLALRNDVSNAISEINDYSLKDESFTITKDSLEADLLSFQNSIRKPRLIVVGPYNTDRSAFINNLLGEDILPSSWLSLTTSIPIKIVHSSEKPYWMTGNTVLIKNDVMSGEQPTEASQLKNKDYYDSHVLEEGSRNILDRFYDAFRFDYDSKLDTQGIIITYVDCQILNTIEIWDTPGIDVEDNTDSNIDKMISLDARNNADAIVYMMQSTSFMHPNDFPLLTKDIEKLPLKFNNKNGLGNLANLFVLASQADIVEDKRYRVLEEGAKKFNSTLTPHFYEKIQGNSQEVAQRFFALSNVSKHSHISAEFNADFKKFISGIDSIILEDARVVKLELLEKYKKLSNKIIENLSSALNDRESLLKEIDELEQQKEKVFTTNESINLKQKRIVEKERHNSKEIFRDYYTNLLSENILIDKLNKADIKNNTDDKSKFIQTINNLLSDQLNDILKKSDESFSLHLDYILDEAQIDTNINPNSFDFRATAFGIIGSGMTLGAFGLISAGITSNLGLYILVAEIGGILTSAGIISSPTIATSVVGATGGPVGWVIAISLIVAVGMYSLFGNWKKVLVKKIIKEYENQNVLNNSFDSIDRHMDNTIEGIDKITEGSNIVYEENINIKKNLVYLDPAVLDQKFKNATVNKAKFINLIESI